uniref:YkgJ family cysteine cluster protein n=1 Tax=Desulfobacca acetoxidans TaxID=60893 RepID=A0A7V4G750_9BACT
MPPWLEIDEELAAKVKNLVAEALHSTPAPSPAVALEVTRQILQLADRIIEEFETVHALPHPIVCQAGCSFCCHNQVQLTPPEAFLLGYMLQSYASPEKQQAVTEMVIREAGRKRGQTPARLAAGRKANPCPLLLGDRCGLYPWRPLMCRAMHSFDAAHCRSSLERGDLAADACYLHRHVFAVSLSKGLQEGFRVLGCRPATLEMSQALEVVLTEPDALSRWLRGKEVFRPQGE